MNLPDNTQFKYKELELFGDKCWLITPENMGTTWSDENSHFRSCIIRQSDNHIISLGFKKFCNWGESPTFQPWNNDWKFEAYGKIDGSLLICSKYKGNLITRTRGTSDARQLPNGHEIDLLIQKYPKLFNNEYIDCENWSILCEWTTPENVIVIREHVEPTLTLIGMIRHDLLSYMPQQNLDSIALKLDISRPQRYEYNSVAECLSDVKLWQNREGVVIYSKCNDIWPNQTLKKIKADLYLEAHKIATGIKNINNVVDMFLASPKFEDADDYYTYIYNTLGFEIAEKCSSYIEEVCRVYRLTNSKIKNIENFINSSIRFMETRKMQAIAIQNEFSDWEISYSFLYLDNRPFPDKLLPVALKSQINPSYYDN